LISRLEQLAMPPTGPIEGGNPVDGHTLAETIPDMEALIGNMLQRILADAGYRGHNAPAAYKFRIYTSGQKRRLKPQIKRELRRREPVICHIKGRAPQRHVLVDGEASRALAWGKLFEGLKELRHHRLRPERDIALGNHPVPIGIGRDVGSLEGIGQLDKDAEFIFGELLRYVRYPARS
jgi:hypothetical protein